MFLKIIVQCYVFTFLSSFGFAHNTEKSIENPNEISTPCSKNISNVYLNIMLLIDVSTYMSNENIRQLSLNLQSAFSKIPIGDSCQNHTSGFAVIAYSNTSKVVANLTEIKSASDLARALSTTSLKIPSLASSNSAAGIRDAYQNAKNILSDYVYTSEACQKYAIPRNTVYLFIGASMNDVNIQSFYDDINKDLKDRWNETFITINYNMSDTLLTEVFNNISHFSTYGSKHYPAYNFSVGDKNLYSDLKDALTQSCCTCVAEFYQLVLFDNTKNRWERYADCYSPQGFNFEFPSSALTVCQMIVDGSMGAAVTSKTKKDFIDQHVPVQLEYYIGLHRNVKNAWVWTDFDGSEFPLGEYAPWMSGYGPNSPGECVLSFEKDINNTTKTMEWMPTKCTDYNINILCQFHACDADYLDCGANFFSS